MAQVKDALARPTTYSVSWKQHELASSFWNLKPTGRGFCPLRPNKGTTHVCHGPPQFDSPLQTRASRSLTRASFVDTRVLRTDPQSSKSPLPCQCVVVHIRLTTPPFTPCDTNPRRQSWETRCRDSGAGGVLQPYWSRMVFRTQFPPVTKAYVHGHPFTGFGRETIWWLPREWHGWPPLQPSRAAAPANLLYQGRARRV